MPEPTWERFIGGGGRDVVGKEISKCFKNDKRGRAQLFDLMKRLREDQILGREVEDLGGGLHEAKLSYRGQEFRLFFARRRRGLVLLALHVVNKKAQRVPRSIELARSRLAEWDRRTE